MLGTSIEDEMQLLNFNDLEYQQDPVVSTVATRAFVTHEARQLSNEVVLTSDPDAIYREYDDPIWNQPKSKRLIQVDVPSGNRYVDPKSSYVAFRVRVEYPYELKTPLEPAISSLYRVGLNANALPQTPEPQEQVPTKHGELWTSLIKHARWIHSSKREIDNIHKSDHESYLYTQRQSSDWQQSIGSNYRRDGPPHTPAIYPDQLFLSTIKGALGYDAANTVELVADTIEAGTIIFADGAGPPVPDARLLWQIGDRIELVGGQVYIVTAPITQTTLRVKRYIDPVVNIPASTGDFIQYQLLPNPAPLNEETTDVLIPLAVLFPSWRQDKHLMPSQLVGGSLFEFELNPIQDAFFISIFNDSLIGDNQYYVFPESFENLRLSSFKYTVTDFRVVLDEREMLSSISSLMWNVSMVAGTPLQIADSAIDFQRRAIEPFNVTVKEVKENEGVASLVQNISRVDEMATTVILEPSDIIFDLFLPKLRTPVLGADVDFLVNNEYRFKSGFRYWPDKEPTFSGAAVDGYVSRDAFLQYCVRYPHTSLTYRQWVTYINAFFKCFRRAQDDTTTGVAITHKRPMELRHAFYWSAQMMDEFAQFKEKYVLRHQSSMCRYLNVYGNVLESRN